MRLDLSAFRYLSNDDFRVLTAIEMGMRNHEIVPVSLIESISKIKRVNTNKVIANLLKFKLVEHSNLKYDGYSLNYIGYDYLAIHTLIKRGVLMRIGPKLGVGKESDVYICWVNPQAGIGTELSDEELKKLQNEMIVEFMKQNDNESENSDEDNQEEENSNESDEENSEENSEEEENVETNLAKHNENLHKKNLQKKINKNFSEIIQEEKEAERLNNMKEETYIENEENMRFDEELIINDIKCKIAVIKIARLGRTSFRAVKNKRDYVKNKTHYNWLYLSRVSATNEFKYLTGLYNSGFSVPIPYEHNRHAILMDYIPSYQLSRIEDLGEKEKAFNELVSTLVKLATKGLIHGDFNEFNILVHMKTQKIYFIDFPQMISLEHEDAKKYFNRDIGCVNKFFFKKFGVKFDNNIVNFDDIVREDYLDITLKAYGFTNVMKRLKNENVIHEKKERDIKFEKEDNENEEDKEENEEEAGNNNEEEDYEKIKEMKKNKKKLKKIEQNLLKNNKNILKENIFFDEDDMHLDHNELEKLGLNKDKQEDEKLNMKLSKNEIREKVKKALVKQINNTGVKGKSNRFKSKKEGKIDE
jgi:RIO kinase 2